MNDVELKEVDIMLTKLEQLLEPDSSTGQSPGMPQEIQEIEARLVVYVKPMLAEIHKLKEENWKLASKLLEFEENQGEWVLYKNAKEIHNSLTDAEESLKLLIEKILNNATVIDEENEG